MSQFHFLNPRLLTLNQTSFFERKDIKTFKRKDIKTKRKNIQENLVNFDLLLKLA